MADQRDASNSMILVPLFEPEVRNHLCRKMCANFGFGALAASRPAIALAVEFTRSTESNANWRADNENSHRTPAAATDRRRCGGPWPCADVCVLARLGPAAAATRAAMDPGAARGLRARRDAALPAVRPRCSARLGLPGALSTLSQRALPRGIRPRPGKEAISDGAR